MPQLWVMQFYDPDSRRCHLIAIRDSLSALIRESMDWGDYLVCTACPVTMGDVQVTQPRCSKRWHVMRCSCGRYSESIPKRSDEV